MEAVMSSTEFRIQADRDPPQNNNNGSCAVSSSSASAVFRKIDFHPARKPFNGFSNGGSDFKIETLNPCSGNKRAFSSPSAKKPDGSDSLEHLLDPELSFSIHFRKIGAGLENLGNTCFLNSVIQCLTYTEPLAAYLHNAAHQQRCHVAGFCALCALQKHVRTARQATGRTLTPKYLVSNLRCVSRNFRNFRQEDAHEYMIKLLECMHKCCLPSGVPSESSDAYRTSLVHKIFGGSLRSQVKCAQCSHCSNKFDPFLDLSLDISKADSLQRALGRFTAVELLDDGSKVYQCERCKQKVKAIKQLTVSKAPNVLTVHLKRFEAHRDVKIDKKVQFPSAIDMKPFVSGTYEGNLKYTLYGVLVHSGRSMNSGHYSCFIRTSSGMWYALDDNKVYQVSERKVFEQKAYMLFYVRDKQNAAPKNPVAMVKKETPKESLATNRSSLIIPSNINDQVNGSTVLKACSSSALVANGSAPAPLKSCDLGVPAVLNLKDLNSKETQKSPLSSEVAKGIIKMENGSASEPLKSCDLGAAAVLTQKDLNANETQKSPPSNVEAKEILKTENGSASAPLKSCDLGAPAAFTEKDLNAKEALPKEVPLPQGNGDGSLVKEDSMAGCAILPGKVLALLDGSKSAHSPVSLPTSESKAEKSTDEKNSVNSFNEPNSLKALGQRLEESATSTESVKATSGKETTTNPRKTCKRNMKSLQVGLKFFKLTLSLRKNKKQKRGRSSTSAVKIISEEHVSEKEATAQEHSTSQIAGQVASGSSCLLGNDNIVSGHSERISSSNGNMLLGSQTGELKERTNQNGAVLASDQQQPLRSSDLSEATQNAKRKRESSKEEEILLQNESMTILTRGLPETFVAKWDEEVSVSERMRSNSGGKSIGYVADEWDEEYDRGKKKKIRVKEESYGGPNPFQKKQTETNKQRQRMNTAKTGFRI